MFKNQLRQADVVRQNLHGAAVALTARHDYIRPMARLLLACMVSNVLAMSLHLHPSTLTMFHAGYRISKMTVVNSEISAMPTIMPYEPLVSIALNNNSASVYTAISSSLEEHIVDRKDPDLRAQSTGFSDRQAQLNRRTELNKYEYAVAQHNCYNTILINYCLQKARDRMIDNKMQIRTDQIALDDERRAMHARKHVPSKFYYSEKCYNARRASSE
ncbi:hypothetical protein [Candidatus Vallotia cooleyia]|uniref:hypothetical protein n=1 Tax=Candidatus Vallotiella adelgis TaxID=1177211 RepID=UPI001D00FCCB|nr:hypothetical protein [Candidatus Vallotia cooleyia]UDG81948.1 hypothetical protein GJV44_00166 [Candidatus Vallotia cooleyia]